jgi:2-polyprenyl-3-methyl-5-hydroxy-6-metoxy-1,4-benzoquinol methylase
MERREKPMNTYQDLYDGYVSSGLPFEGEETINSFKKKAEIFQKQFGRFLPANPEAPIADLGCGTGNLLWWLQDRGYGRTCGTDIGQESLEKARQLGVKNVEQADLKDFLQDRENMFSVIFARDVLEHIPKRELPGILRLCRNSLADDGILLAQVPNAESPFFGHCRYGDFTHETAFTKRSLMQVLYLAGFRDFHFYPLPPPRTGLKSTVRLVAWKVLEAVYKTLIRIETGQHHVMVTQNIIFTAAKPGPERNAWRAGNV